MSLSESALKKLSKDEVIALALEYYNKFDSTLTNINKEIFDLRQNYEKMQSELCVSGQVSSKLRKQTVSLERQCWSNCQYSWRECLELSGLPESIKNSELEDTVVQLFKKLDVEVDSSNIEQYGSSNMALKLLMFKVCRIIDILKVEFFIFSGNERVSKQSSIYFL